MSTKSVLDSITLFPDDLCELVVTYSHFQKKSYKINNPIIHIQEDRTVLVGDETLYVNNIKHFCVIGIYINFASIKKA